MSIILLTIFYAAGILQALILCVALLRKKTLKIQSNRMLVCLLVSILFILIQYTFVVNQFNHGIGFLSTMATVSWFAIGPLFYLFVRTSIDSRFMLKASHGLYFTFAIYNLLHYSFRFFNLDIGFYNLFENFVVYSYVWLSAYLLHGIIFSSMTISILRVKGTPKTSGMLTYFYVFLGLLCVAAIYLLFSSNGLVYFNSLERILVVVFSFFALLLTFKSLRLSSQFDAESTGSKYSNSVLSKTEFEMLHNRLVAVMVEQKPYLDRKLSLKRLAEISEIKENKLSQVFSLYLDSSFYDFIREYRLQEVENLLKDPKFGHLKIASLATDCGFNSNAAFYKAFKERHGMTPTEYLEAT